MGVHLECGAALAARQRAMRAFGYHGWLANTASSYVQPSICANAREQHAGTSVDQFHIETGAPDLDARHRCYDRRLMGGMKL